MNERLKVMHVITGLNLGGAETWLLRLLSRLPAERFDSHVVSLLDGGELSGAIRSLGVPVTSLGMGRGVPDPRGLVRLARLMRAQRPQVVQTWLYHADLLGLLAARWSGCGAAVSWGLRCAYMDLARYGLGTRMTLSACVALSGWPEAVTANSQAGADHHLALGYRPRRLVVLENGVDGGRFRPDVEARARLRREWGLSQSTPLIGLVARVDPMKGHAVFCRAAAELSRTRPDARFLFCGEGTEPGAAELDALIAQHGLAGSAVRLGRREDMAQVYAALDVLALPSLGEGFPNAVLEALSCAVPCACLDAGDARAMCGPGGLVAPPALSGPEATEADRAGYLSQALRELLRLSPAARAEMGRQGREHVLARYGLEQAVERWAAHFESLAGGQKTLAGIGTID
ncbi:MAG: group 1 glycosyl transferase [Deltaproteobacteria bacterium HGW-Deltaproteobacteria-8]|jgi:glycosyltransferase involved in cell wall biosynthesis|nr:MAG: group 1 glycosyl transferase [Deltaproteobacteria bacterium HGW-Deltaproteobacteria-8]